MEKRQLEDTKRERQAPSTKKKKSTSHTTNYKCGRSFGVNKSSERGEKGASCSDGSLNVLFMCVYALFQELFTVDVSEAAEEGQRGQRLRVPDPHVARHPLDQAHETLQLGHHVV